MRQAGKGGRVRLFARRYEKETEIPVGNPAGHERGTVWKKKEGEGKKRGVSIPDRLKRKTCRKRQMEADFAQKSASTGPGPGRGKFWGGGQLERTD